MAAAQGDGAVVLYRAGLELKDQSISLKSWGSGIITETDDTAYEGTKSVRVTTKNHYQGGSMIFGNAANLAAASADKSNLLRITFKTLDSATGSTGGPAGGGRGGPGIGGPPPSGGRGGGAAGGLGQGGGEDSPGGAFGGSGGRGGGVPGAGGAQTTLSSMRVIITTTDGLKSEAVLSVSSAGTDRGWKQSSIPLSAIKGFDRTNKVVKQVSFAGDTSTAFYVGELRVVSDKTPIRGEPNVRTMMTNVGIPVVFSATGSGGSSSLKYSWDFDDADGIQVDAEGQAVRHKFRQPSMDQRNPAASRKNGEFIVTLTISDAYGVKEPYSTQIKVKVNP